MTGRISGKRQPREVKRMTNKLLLKKWTKMAKNEDG
jgi:hypothetical protein